MEIFSRYRLPGSPEVCDRAISVHFWRETFPAVGLPQTNGVALHIPMSSSTTREDYLQGVKNAIRELTLLDGERNKVVISRIIAGKSTPAKIKQAAEALFATDDSNFVFHFSHPSTGSWLGASPELLLEKNTLTDSYRTMALAGTRPQGLKIPWDSKNLAEHRSVVEYIRENCSNLTDTAVEISDIETVPYGTHIEHLRTRIKIDTAVRFDTLAATLSPTPALCGYPRDFAARIIEKTEKHQRLCYGGYLKVVDGDSLRAYVTLRCLRYDTEGNYNIYVGGGITKDSDPEAEFAETEAKAEGLLELLR